MHILSKTEAVLAYRLALAGVSYAEAELAEAGLTGSPGRIREAQRELQLRQFIKDQALADLFVATRAKRAAA